MSTASFHSASCLRGLHTRDVPLIISRSSSVKACRPAHLRSHLQPKHLKACTCALHHQSASVPQANQVGPKPHVVLIGWLGAQERHFNKYVKLWQDMGHTTYGYRPSTPSIVLPPVGSAKAAEFIRDLQSSGSIKGDQPVIYHIFRALAAADASKNQSAPETGPLSASTLQHVQGLILDSAPCRLTPDISARGFTAAVLSKPAESIQSRHPRLVAAAEMLFTPVLRLPLIANRQEELYLYSSADALIPPSEVQKFQKSQQARGVKIRSRMWEDSAHCEHYRIHPDEYMDQLQQFIKSCC